MAGADFLPAGPSESDDEDVSFLFLPLGLSGGDICSKGCVGDDCEGRLAEKYPLDTASMMSSMCLDTVGLCVLMGPTVNNTTNRT